MQFFEVTLLDNSTLVMQARNQRHIREILADVVITKIQQKPTCKDCRGAIAIVQDTLCQSCYDAVFLGLKELYEIENIHLSEQETEDLIISYCIRG